MAIAVEHASIGTPVGQDPGNTQVQFTTNVAIAAGSFIVVFVGGFIASGATMTVAGGGLTWTTDKQGNPASPSASFTGIASAQAPSGLASGTTITATYSGSAAARQIGGSSFTGVGTSSPVDTTSGPTGIGAAQQPWASASTSIQAGSLLVACNYAESGGTTSTASAGSTELLDWQSAASPTTMTACYRIESSAGSYTVAGTWLVAQQSSMNAVAYKEGAPTSAVAIEHDWSNFPREKLRRPVF
jgi:hypothetical protein